MGICYALYLVRVAVPVVRPRESRTCFGRRSPSTVCLLLQKSLFLRFGSLHNFNFSCSRERDRSPAEAIADCATEDCLLIQPTDDCFPPSSFLLLSFLPRSGFLSFGCFLFEAGVKLRTDRDRESAGGAAAAGATRRHASRTLVSKEDIKFPL